MAAAEERVRVRELELDEQRAEFVAKSKKDQKAKNKVIKSQINAEMKRLQQQEEERRRALESKILNMEADLAEASAKSSNAAAAQAIADEQAAERKKFGAMKAAKVAELDAKFEAKKIR